MSRHQSGHSVPYLYKIQMGIIFSIFRKIFFLIWGGNFQVLLVEIKKSTICWAKLKCENQIDRNSVASRSFIPLFAILNYR